MILSFISFLDFGFLGYGFSHFAFLAWILVLLAFSATLVFYFM